MHENLSTLCKVISPDEQGFRVYHGLRSKYRQIIYNMMISQNVSGTISNMTDLCRHADEMSYDRDNDASDTYTLTASQAAMFPNEWKSNGNRQQSSSSNNTYQSKSNSDTVGQKRSRDDSNHSNASKYQKPNDNSKGNNKGNDGKNNKSNSKRGGKRGQHRNKGNDTSNYNAKSNSTSNMTTANTTQQTVAYQSPPASQQTIVQPNGRQNRSDAFDFL